MNVVAFDFLGHGESPRPHQSELYTANEVSDRFAKFNTPQSYMLYIIMVYYTKGRDTSYC